MRNKNTIKQSLLLAVLLPFLAFSVVFANHGAEVEEEEAHSEETAPVKMEERMKEREMLEAKRAEMRQERQDGREERREGRRANRALAIKTVMEMQIARSTKAFDRLSMILDKIEAKSEDMPEGADMTKVDAAITKAKAQEAALKTALDKAQEDFEDLLATKVEEAPDDAPSETSQPVLEAKQVVKTFMTTMKDIKKQLIEFHKTLHETVKAMRTAAKAVETEAGSEEEQEEETENTSSTNN